MNLPSQTGGPRRLKSHERLTPIPPREPAFLLMDPLTMRTLVIAVAATAALVPVWPVDAASTGFNPGVVTFGETRQQLQATPVLERPYRPLHVYGNTVRRRHSRGPR
jgi:hypothetical protein